MATNSRNYKKKKRKRDYKEEIYLLSPAVDEDYEMWKAWNKWDGITERGFKQIRGERETYVLWEEETKLRLKERRHKVS